MGTVLRAGLSILLLTVLLNLCSVLATLVFHEAGHYAAGAMSGCEDIRIVTLSSSNGTYTEMRCPTSQGSMFPVFGAMLFTVPFGLAFLLLGGHPEKYLGLVSIGFNLSVSLVDMPAPALQYVSLFAGFALVVAGEVMLIDKLLTTFLFDPASISGTLYGQNLEFNDRLR
jgi:hypothetical protein